MMGRHHARLLQTTPRIAFAGAVDPLGDRHGAVRDAGSVHATIEQLVDRGRPDFAVVAVPTDEHLATVRALADAGVHVLVEKPLAGSVAGGRGDHRDLPRRRDPRRGRPRRALQPGADRAAPAHRGRPGGGGLPDRDRALRPVPRPRQGRRRRQGPRDPRPRPRRLARQRRRSTSSRRRRCTRPAASTRTSCSSRAACAAARRSASPSTG